MEIAEFLLARFAEDEVAARDAYGVRWEVIEGVNASQVLVHRAEIRDDRWRVGHLGHVATVERGHDVAHIARWDPARVLAECDAKRRLVSLHSGERTGQPCTTVRLLALPYADHVDYQQEWKP